MKHAGDKDVENADVESGDEGPMAKPGSLVTSNWKARETAFERIARAYAYPEAHCSSLAAKIRLAENLLLHLDELNGERHETLLNLAVRHSDAGFATYLLQHGANPRNVNRDACNAEMTTLLDFAIGKNRIYSRAAQQGRQSPSTDLDRALQDMRIDDAGKLFDALRGGRTEMHQVCEDVHLGREDRPEILRALYLLASSEQRLKMISVNNIDYDENVKGAENGSMLQRAMKKLKMDIPFAYESAKRGKMHNLNGKAIISGTDKWMLCRHLVPHHVLKSDPKTNKFNYNEEFKDVETLSKKVPEDIQRRSQILRNCASEVHLVDTTQVGKFLENQLATMKRQDEEARKIMTSTSSHLMDMLLRIKPGKDGNTVYVENFFDPNRTTGHARTKAANIEEFSDMTFADITGHSTHVPGYFRDKNDKRSYVVLYVLTAADIEKAKEHIDAGRIPPAPSNRAFTTQPDEALDSCGLWHAMYRGMAESVTAQIALLKRQLENGEISDAELVKLLTTENSRGHSGLYLALQHGNAATVAAFGQLLKLLPEASRTAVLHAAKMKNGESGLSHPLGHDDTATVAAFGELLKLAPEADRAALLSFKRPDGTSGIAWLLQNGNAATLAALGELLKLVPEADRAALLAEKGQVGKAGISWALDKGDAAKTDAVAKLLKLVPEADRAALLTMDGLFGIASGLQNGNAANAAAVGRLLKLVPDADRARLTMINDVAVHELFRALRNEDAAKVAALGELLESVPEADRAFLFARESVDGASLIAWLLDANHAESHADKVAAMGRLLQHLPEKVCLSLLNAGVETLRDAINRVNADFVKDYAALVNAVAPSLNRTDRIALLNKIRTSHATKHTFFSMSFWLNHYRYKVLKRVDPEAYTRFKSMKRALKRNNP